VPIWTPAPHPGSPASGDDWLDRAHVVCEESRKEHRGSSARSAGPACITFCRNSVISGTAAASRQHGLTAARRQQLTGLVTAEAHRRVQHGHLLEDADTRSTDVQSEPVRGYLRGGLEQHKVWERGEPSARRSPFSVAPRGERAR
jgi:hypothetical protein